MSTAALQDAWIVPAQGILTMLSRAWALLKRNLKTSVLVMLGPTLAFTGLYLLNSLLAVDSSLTPTSPVSLGIRLLLILGVVVLAIPCFLYWVFSCCVLSRYYYSAMTEEHPYSVRDCWQYMRSNWLTLGSMVTMLVLSLIGLVVVDFVIVFAGVFLASLIFGAIGASTITLGNSLSKIMMFFFLLLIGFFIVALVISLIAFQAFLFAFPLLAIATGKDSKISRWRQIGMSLQLIFRHFPRVILFSLAMFLFTSVLMTVLMSPAWIWGALEISRVGLSQPHSIPLHVQTVWNLWSSLANLLMTPFQLSAVTLFWYDCQVRSEGVDLARWIVNLMNRQTAPGNSGVSITPRQV